MFLRRQDKIGLYMFDLCFVPKLSTVMTSPISSNRRYLCIFICLIQPSERDLAQSGGRSA